jgi:hypothetical protein
VHLIERNCSWFHLLCFFPIIFIGVAEAARQFSEENQTLIVICFYFTNRIGRLLLGMMAL